MSFKPTLKILVRTYQAFERFSKAHIRSLGLTVPQFDVIATLANQPPMCARDLAEKVIMTKSTISGVLDRLESKGLINRTTDDNDHRYQFISLTKQGMELFNKVFPPHAELLLKIFDELPAERRQQLNLGLVELQESFKKYTKNFTNGDNE